MCVNPAHKRYRLSATRLSADAEPLAIVDFRVGQLSTQDLSVSSEQTESTRQQKAVSMSSARATEESFLEACPENTRPFFRQLIAEATERGHVISWGRVGFSVRIPLHNNKLVSLLYGYPPGVHGLSAPIFQAYFGYIDNKDAYNTARSEFLDSIAFSPRGEYTLEIALDALQTVEAATAAIPIVLDIAQRAVKPEHTENDAG